MKMTVNQINQYEDIIQELKITLKELEDSQSLNPIVGQCIQEEKREVQQALHKVKMKSFGYCELSGQEIPFEFIKTNPTIQNMEQVNEWLRYGKKTMEY
jgi:RNA polymerase-binding transcription factor DksA